jgi:Asp-tRNA(Asn)/Glu-tRNA(Gln) amidotransferase A subunit family amidase
VGRELAALIRERKLSSREVMSAISTADRATDRIRKCQDAIGRLNFDRRVQCPSRLADQADRHEMLRLGAAKKSRTAATASPVRVCKESGSGAYGFPCHPVGGISTIFSRDFLCRTEDCALLVERLRAAGGGISRIGKTNVSLSFGMGSQHLQSKLYGTTVNP